MPARGSALAGLAATREHRAESGRERVAPARALRREREGLGRNERDLSERPARDGSTEPVATTSVALARRNARTVATSIPSTARSATLQRAASTSRTSMWIVRGSRPAHA